MDKTPELRKSLELHKSGVLAKKGLHDPPVEGGPQQTPIYDD